MFDFGFGELLLLGVIALVVLGPERLPVAARLLGRWIRTARSQWNAVKAELENEIADEELRRNLRDAADAMREGVRPLTDGRAGLADVGGLMTRTVAPAAAAVAPSPAPNAEANAAATDGAGDSAALGPAQGRLFDADPASADGERSAAADSGRD